MWPRLFRTAMLATVLTIAGFPEQSSSPAAEEAVAAAYPGPALDARVSGAVVVSIQVSERGTVTGASVTEGDALLRQASLEAARLWRFRAQPGVHSVKLIFNFRFMPRNTPEAQLGPIFKPPYTVEIRKITPEPVTHYAKAIR
ncbi:MAG: TonB family protein [Bryobacteraceae bacterium]